VIRAVVDTNVLVSGIVSQRLKPPTATAAVVAAWRAGLFELVLSTDIIGEVDRTLRKPYFARRIDDATRTRLLGLLRRRSRVIELTIRLSGIATHPEDDLVLSAAVSARADYLVTGDRPLLALASQQDVSVVSPRAFLAILQETT
jgi:putative PIN family toxin of toxin-antitoxin system